MAFGRNYEWGNPNQSGFSNECDRNPSRVERFSLSRGQRKSLKLNSSVWSTAELPLVLNLEPRLGLARPMNHHRFKCFMLLFFWEIFFRRSTDEEFHS